MILSQLSVKRLVIFTNEGLVAYDEKFHDGVNIIRGDNSSGKSTISNLLFFILGGVFNDFVPEAKLCSEVYAEVVLNQAVLTLKRRIELNEEGKVNSKVAVYFFWGNYNEAISPSVGETWHRFDYNSYSDKKSFSNVFFDNLDIPIVKGDSNITMHQLLRLMYIDQDSPTNSLFYYEQFDSQITRETTAELLLGIYNEELYQKKRRLIEVNKDLDDVKSEIRLTKGFFSDPLTLNPSHIATRIDNAELQISEIEKKISELKQSDTGTAVLKLEDFRFNELNNSIAKQRGLVNQLQDNLKTTELEISDNEFFLESLNNKLKALKNSVVTREFLNNFPINFCPECLTEIRESESETHCKLCKEKIDATFGITQARRMELEIGFQITESSEIQKDLKDKVDKLNPVLKKARRTLVHYQRQYDEEVQDVNTTKQEQLQKLYTEKGFNEGELLQFRTLLERAEYYNNLITRRNRLGDEKEALEYYIRVTENNQTQSKLTIEGKIRSEGLYFLNNDLHRQDEFKNANDFHIDFSNNIAFLSNKFSKYSASSNFYLKIAARFSILLASLQISSMRYPRFILADNMEDKGIEKERAQNFQKILIDRLSKFSIESYQVIYTTSYITEELNGSNLVIGEYYTKDNRTLKHIHSHLN